MRCSALTWPMTGSTAARRFISRRIGRVTRRTWPVIHTRNFSVWLGPRLPLATWTRGGDRHLAAELIRRPGLALANALDLGGMQRIHLVAALAVVLEAHPVCQGE